MAETGSDHWQYRVEQASFLNPDRLTDDLNRLGAEGWEAVGITTMRQPMGLTYAVLLKRPGLGKFTQDPNAGWG